MVVEGFLKLGNCRDVQLEREREIERKEGGREHGGKAGFKRGRMESRLMDLQNNTIPSISVTERTHIQPGLYTANVLHVITLPSWSSYSLRSPALNPAAVVPTNHLY